MSCRRSSRFWGLGCPKIFHEIEDSLVAFHLGEETETRQATSAIQKWMQTELDRAGDPHRVHVSQWLQERILLEIVDKELSEKYFRWWLKEED